MKARDVKCPKCGEGLADVAPDLDLGHEPSMGSPVAVDHFAHCRSGHGLFVSCRPTNWEEVRVYVTPQGEGTREDVDHAHYEP